MNYIDSCSCCGKCCSNYLPLSKKEINKLKYIVKSRKIQPYKQVFTSDHYSVCPFLNNSNKCIIYNDRPLICKCFTCNKMKYKDFSNMNELLEEKRELTDVRKVIFNK